MADYAIFIPEDDFIKNPIRELQKLADIAHDDLERLLEGLAFAQRVMLPDHPDTLYIIAFLREAATAMEYRAPMDWIAIDKKWRRKLNRMDIQLDQFLQAQQGTNGSAG